MIKFNERASWFISNNYYQNIKKHFDLENFPINAKIVFIFLNNETNVTKLNLVNFNDIQEESENIHSTILSCVCVFFFFFEWFKKSRSENRIVRAVK